MAEGLRERKKRQTRQHLSDVATGLFLQRGFDAVTIAEIADAADVSVNTVYNYFPAKEDLFFDRSKGIVDRLPRCVRARAEGESAAAAVLRELRREVETGSPDLGLIDGYADFMRVVMEAHTLRSRLCAIQQEVVQRLEETLRAETGAADGDPLPTLMAGQLAWIQSALMGWIGAEMVKGRKAGDVSRGALALLDDMAGMLGEQVLKYAVREG
ncbi:TetR/AcrR family transcriptional regulator [Streptomyces sp. PR69]|uniref:TetR/AcrR family transcriptional regulator n=1 Tax=Streptomyces sp. PR69 TaxID=2984950 RepID=UPI00226510A0|nr:TetR/AcrR family transcriptional regulator [Streptomyces sp. PR69]